MANLNPHHLNDKECQKVMQDAVTYLRSFRSEVAQAVLNLISDRDYDNQQADDFLQVVLDTFVVIDQEVQQDTRTSGNIFNERQDYEGAITKGVQQGMAYVAMTCQNIRDQLTDQEYNELDNTYKEYEELNTFLYGQQPSNRFGGNQGGGRFDQGNRGSNGSRFGGPSAVSSSRFGGRRDSMTGGGQRQQRRSSQYGRGEAAQQSRQQRQHPSGNSRTQSAPVQSRGKYGRGQREEVVEQMPANAIEVPDVVPANESKFRPTCTPGGYGAKAYNPSRSGIFHVSTEQGIAEAVLDYGDGMEKYEEHELFGSPINTKSRGEKIIPEVDFTTVPDLVDEEAVKAEPKLCTLPDRLSVSCNGWVPDVNPIAHTINSGREYTLYSLDQHRMMAYPKGLKDEVEKLSSVTSFEGWHNAMIAISKSMETGTGVDVGITANFLAQLDADMTMLFNNLLAVCCSFETTVKSFYKDFPDAYKFLKAPEQRTEHGFFRDCEKDYLRRNYKAMSKEMVAKEVSDGNIVEAKENEVTAYLWVRSTYVILNVYGEVLSNTLQLTDNAAICDLDYEKTPDFHSLCENVVRRRNEKLSMANVMLTDSFGSVIMVLASKYPNAPMRVCKM